ncbi:MATE family efflux transporter [Pseudazoarcus pumilus]|uniref:MATE family efflux transporter n=1 Tax=Pseudazoarcus pumilus TaxID=2067960 RepID=A0A2I6S305_9RHOO|nr:MATE family efflux transporter [Pseudazoarcus pumilus]AUN93597.1 MATE family efflux transporter [Pseudazoarcus pumilus]
MTALDDHPRPTHRSVLALAVPVMLSNVSTPLIGIVDTAVVGQIPDPAHIGAVAVAALVFTFVFWAFGFLRMGTTGLTAQALGARDGDELLACLGRAMLIAGVVGAGLIALQWPIRETAFALLDGSERVEALAREYFDIRIWAAPMTLANYALLGWFIGQGRSGTALVLQLTLNLSNVALDLLFVLGLGMGVAGVALGTLLAESIAAVIGLGVAWVHARGVDGRLSRARLLDAARLARTLAVNRDIMIRSMALIFVLLWFVAQGARQGEVVLAANAVLMHFIATASYFLDGLAFAAEALVGRAVGAARRALLDSAVFLTTFWAVLLAGVLSLAFLLAGPLAIDVLTVDPATRLAAREHLAWAAMAPLIGVWAFQLDGIFIGATRSAEMRNAMLASLAIFLAAWWALRGWGNHGLWAAYHVCYVARALTLGRYYPRLTRALDT